MPTSGLCRASHQAAACRRRGSAAHEDPTPRKNTFGPPVARKMPDPKAKAGSASKLSEIRPDWLRGQGLNLRPSGYEAPDEGLQAGSNSCKPLETLDSSGGHSEAAMQAVSSEHKDLASRWSAAVSREFSMKVPTTACSLPHRRRLASMSPSTCFAEPALRGVSNTGGSSMRSGSRQPPLLPSRAPGGLRKGRTRDGCRGSPD